MSIKELCDWKCFQRWERCLTVPGTRKVHCITRANNTDVFVSNNSQYKIQDEFPGKQQKVIRQHSSSADEDEETSTGDEVDDPSDGKFSACTPKQNQATQSPHIIYGLPKDIETSVTTSPAEFPSQNETLITSLLEGMVDFADGKTILDKRDLFALYGHNQKPEDNYLTNFIIDAYLKLIASKSATQGTKVVCIEWERFNKWDGKSSNLFKHLPHLLQQDYVFVPWNTASHWVLVAALPKQKHILVLDSLAIDSTKPSARKAIDKMWMLLSMEDSSLDASEWGFYTNTPHHIPQQDNSFDCGVFICLYARCLALKYPLPICISSYRKQMVVELHRQKIDGPLLPGILVEQYYAVDYINRFYVGRVLAIQSLFCNVKFLHCGSKGYSWPNHDDIECVHKSYIFYGPVTLSGFGPFTVLEQSELEKVHQCLKKSKKFS